MNTESSRVSFLDNLRTFTIFLVILYHSGGVYESSGLWAAFWIVDDSATNEAAGLLNIFLDIIVMPSIFFVSGYVTPSSIKNRTSGKFIVDKFKRLMIPWLIAVLTLVPLYYTIFLYSRGLPQQDWTAYFHFSEGAVTGQGWLWFLPVLFLFNLLYLGLARLGLLPVKFSVKSSIIAVFLVAFTSSFAMDFFDARGWILTPFIDFQKERFLLYFLIFLLGAHFFQQDVFATLPKSPKWYYAINVLVWAPAMTYGMIVIYPFLSNGAALISPIADMLVKWLSFCLTLALMLYLVVETFQRYFNKSSKFWRTQNHNSYYVYILHMIVLGGVATLLLDLSIPSLSKFFVLVLATYIISNLIVSISRGLYDRLQRA
jgi:hypothetical protein